MIISIIREVSRNYSIGSLCYTTLYLINYEINMKAWRGYFFNSTHLVSLVWTMYSGHLFHYLLIVNINSIQTERHFLEKLTKNYLEITRKSFEKLFFKDYPLLYRLWDLERFRDLPLYIGFGTWKNSDPSPSL